MTFESADERPTAEAFPRAMLTMGVGVLAWVLSFLGIDLLGRRVVPLSAFAHPRIAAGLALVVAFVALVVAWRRSRFVRSRWWVLFPLVVLPCGFVGTLLVEVRLHVSCGTVLTECEWPGLTIDACSGRDWSYFQDRLWFKWMRGRMDGDRCRRFVAAASSAARSPRSDGDREECSPDDPSVWDRRPCEEFGHDGMQHCFLCSVHDPSGDDYVTSLSFDRACAVAIVTEGANVHPSDVPRCSEATTQEECLAP